MIKLRDSKFIKLICLFLATTLMYISCSTETIMSQNGCSIINNITVDDNEIIENMEVMLDYARSVDYQEDYSTFSEFHQTLYGNGEEASQYVAIFEEESNKYTNLGFEGYVENNDNFSESAKSHILNYAQELSDFLNNEKPDLNEFTAFINAKKVDLSQSSFCDNDKQLISFYLSASQGFANWYYGHYFTEGSLEGDGTNEATVRGCNFITGFICGILALIVGVTVGAIATVVLLLATITYNDDVVQGKNKDAFALLAGVALGLYVGINTYEWCCSLNEVEEQVCEDPTGSAYIQTDCNEFVYRVFGPSDYGATEWKNDNTDPEQAITPTPRLRLSVPSFGDTSLLKAKIACVVEGSSVEFLNWEEDETFESDDDLFPLEWVASPPNNTYFDGSSGSEGDDFDLLNTISVSVNTTSSDVFTYSWSVNSPHYILSGGGSNSNHATIKLGAANPNLTTKVTVTNNCLGTTENLIETTYIQ